MLNKKASIDFLLFLQKLTKNKKYYRVQVEESLLTLKKCSKIQHLHFRVSYNKTIKAILKVL